MGKSNNCETCGAWESFIPTGPTKSQKGSCRKNAPSPTLDKDVQGGLTPNWPTTSINDWCLEWTGNVNV